MSCCLFTHLLTFSSLEVSLLNWLDYVFFHKLLSIGLTAFPALSQYLILFNTRNVRQSAFSAFSLLVVFVTRAFVAGLFVLLFVCTTPTTECVTIIPTNDLGHESKSQFNPRFCFAPLFAWRVIDQGVCGNPDQRVQDPLASYLSIHLSCLLFSVFLCLFLSTIE